MRRKLTISLILVSLIIGLFVIANATQTLTIYKIRDNALAPLYGEGSFLVASKLKKPVYNDLVCFNISTPANKEELVIRRILGLEGDTLEINDDYLLRNGVMADNPNNVMFNYYAYKNRIRDVKIFKNLMIKPLTLKDSIILCLNYSELTKMGHFLLLHKLDKPMMSKSFIGHGKSSETTSQSQIIVPKGYCFVLADNRDNYADSRHWGCIQLSSIKGILFSGTKQ